MQGKVVLGTAAWDAETAPAPMHGAGKGDADFVQPEPIHIPSNEPREESGSREGPQHQPVLLFLAPKQPHFGIAFGSEGQSQEQRHATGEREGTAH